MNLLITMCLIYFCQASHFNDQVPLLVMESIKGFSIKKLFRAYHYLYRKPYDLESDEGRNRLMIFKKSLEFIEKGNGLNLGFSLGLNKFTDLEYDEFQELFKNEIQDRDKNNSSNLNQDEADIKGETKIDHLSFLSDVSEHGNCNSFYAFSVVGTIEAIAKMKLSRPYKLSVQNLINCNTETMGCQGGTLESTYEFIKNNGLQSNKDVPYQSGFTGKTTSCQRYFPTYRILKDYTKGAGQTNMINSLKNGPVSTSVDFTSPYFQYYSKGVLNIVCTKRTFDVILYGYSSDSSGSNIYSVRTSIGVWWGENGNFKINNPCLMDILFYQPTVGN